MNFTRSQKGRRSFPPMRNCRFTLVNSMPWNYQVLEEGPHSHGFQRQEDLLMPKYGSLEKRYAKGNIPAPAQGKGQWHAPFGHPTRHFNHGSSEIGGTPTMYQKLNSIRSPVTPQEPYAIKAQINE